MRTVEEAVAIMPDAEFFTVLDAKTGFWQIPPDKQSLLYTTFSTPVRHYRFKRMPYKIKSGSKVFQQVMEPCNIAVDDIVIWGKTMKELQENLHQILDRAREVGTKLNAKNFKLGVEEVTYVGHKLTAEGLKPDPEKIRAVNEMPPPKDKTKLQRFLGIVNNLSKFISNFSAKTESLRQLILEDIDWCWLEIHKKSI